MAEEKAVLMYKGHPLMRKDNLIYYDHGEEQNDHSFGKLHT
mgnify:CR=1 FL=1